MLLIFYINLVLSNGCDMVNYMSKLIFNLLYFKVSVHCFFLCFSFFLEEKATGTTLPFFSEQELKEIGVNEMGQRKLLAFLVREHTNVVSISSSSALDSKLIHLFINSLLWLTHQMRAHQICPCLSEKL